jgi:hypothetical protein
MNFRKIEILLGISPKKLDVLLNFLEGLHNDFQNKVLLLKPKIVDEAYVEAQYLENIGHKKGIFLSRNTTRMFPRRGRRSGKENKRIQKPLHISARIQTTKTTIAILMVTLKISFGSYI